MRARSLLATLAVVGFALPAAAAAQDTWTGTWLRSEDGVSGNLILEQSGSSVTGRYTWGDGSGRISGTVSGSTLSASFTENNYRGSLTATLKGRSFTGSYSGENSAGGPISGPFNGRCVSGACRMNGGGSEDDSPAPIRIPPSGAWGAACGASATMSEACKPIELTSGQGATTASPELSPKQKEAVLTVVGKVIPIVEAARERRNERIRGCVGVFARIAKGNADDREPDGLTVPLMTLCIRAVFELEQEEIANAELRARASGSACPLASFDVRGGKVRLGDGTPDLAITCTRTADRLQIRVRSQGAPLRSLVGPRLDVAVYRSQTESGPGTATIGFSRP